MKLKTLSALCLAASTMAMTSTAMAWESEDGQHSVSANVGLYTDYIFRGASQTDQDLAVQGGVDYGHSSGIYLGTWASNVNFDDADGEGNNAHIESNIYGGFANEFGETGIGYDVGMLRYIYPGTNGIDFNELYAGLSYSFFSVGIAHTSDIFGSSEDATYYSVGFSYDLPYGIGLSLGAGYYDYEDLVDATGAPGDADSATDYSIGLSKEFAGLSFGLTYTDLDSDGEEFYGVREDSNFVFSVSKSM